MSSMLLQMCLASTLAAPRGAPGGCTLRGESGLGCAGSVAEPGGDGVCEGVEFDAVPNVSVHPNKDGQRRRRHLVPVVTVTGGLQKFWLCLLLPLRACGRQKAHAHFFSVAMRRGRSWREFPLFTAFVGTRDRGRTATPPACGPGPHSGLRSLDASLGGLEEMQRRAHCADICQCSLVVSTVRLT
jgi:hypothetical protein